MNILLVDDDEAFRVPLADYLQRPEVQARFLAEEDRGTPLTVATAGTIADAAAAIRVQPAPNLVLLDLGLRGESEGATTLQRFQDVNADRIPVAIFTGLAPSVPGAVETYRECYQLGAIGVIVKSSTLENMFIGLSRLVKGQKWLSDELFNALVEAPEASKAPGKVNLSPREWDVAVMLTKGYPTKRIAKQLGLAQGHITNVIGDICGKLGVDNRTQVAVTVAKHIWETEQARTPGSTK